MKALFALLLIVVSVSSFAQRRPDRNGNDRPGTDGQITMRDGRTTVRINVGNDNDRDVNMRIRRLEQAVRDLQGQVYDLQDSQVQTRTVTSYVCSITSQFYGTFVGKASSRTEAEALARQKCKAAYDPFYYSHNVTCEKVEEEVVLN